MALLGAAGMVEGAAASAVAASASTAMANVVTHYWLGGNFNPSWKKEDQKRMRYLQQKYALAYGDLLSGAGNENVSFGSSEPNAMISKIDPLSKLKMTTDGSKPANPFPDERSYEEALTMSFHPISGHQGRFAASHAVACLGAIVDYQVKRRNRMWVPGVSGPSKPNSYVNMFLEEMKSWLKTQLCLDIVHADELRRRVKYLVNIKNDDYYWCFPPTLHIQPLLDFIHQRIRNALETVEREEKNKSLQSLFKELCDHTTNSFEFGKTFLAYLLCTKKKLGSDLASWTVLDGESLDTGMLHRLIERTTDHIMKSYVFDMRLSKMRIDDQKEEGGHFDGALNRDAREGDRDEQCMYKVTYCGAEDSTMSSTSFLFLLQDPNGLSWTVRKTISELDTLHKTIAAEYDNLGHRLSFPAPIVNANLVMSLFPNKEAVDERGRAISTYLSLVLLYNGDVKNSTRLILARFFGTKNLISSQTNAIMNSENIPNTFVSLKIDFMSMIVDPTYTATLIPSIMHASPSTLSMKSLTSFSTSSPDVDSRDRMLMEARKVWGVEWTIKIFESYALLHRLATLLSWTLEINQFFVSMFGNTLAFSRLPLRELLFTLREILVNFSKSAEELYSHSCQLNAEEQYKFHKNLHAAEAQLQLVRHHTEKALQIILRIEADHLDLSVQKRRLNEVASRFLPLLNRVDNALPQIRKELGMSVTQNSSIHSNERDYGMSSFQDSSLPLPAISDGIDNRYDHTIINENMRSFSSVQNIAGYDSDIVTNDMQLLASRLSDSSDQIRRRRHVSENKATGTESAYDNDKSEVCSIS